MVAWKQREREEGGGVSMSSRSKRVLQVSPRAYPLISLPLSLSFSLFLCLSFSPTLSCPSRAPFRVLRSPSRSPHLIRLLAFSRMKELQRLSWDTRKYYLARLPTDRPTKTSLFHSPFSPPLSLSFFLSFSLRMKGGVELKSAERQREEK